MADLREYPFSCMFIDKNNRGRCLYTASTDGYVQYRWEVRYRCLLEGMRVLDGLTRTEQIADYVGCRRRSRGNGCSS